MAKDLERGTTGRMMERREYEREKKGREGKGEGRGGPIPALVFDFSLSYVRLFVRLSVASTDLHKLDVQYLGYCSDA